MSRIISLDDNVLRVKIFRCRKNSLASVEE